MPISTELNRLRRHIDNLNRESDYDSEYANHPPPTDSEIEIEINPEFVRSRRLHSGGLPDYMTDETDLEPREESYEPTQTQAPTQAQGHGQLIQRESSRLMLNRMAARTGNRAGYRSGSRSFNHSASNTRNNSYVNVHDSEQQPQHFQQAHRHSHSNNNEDMQSNLLFGSTSRAMEGLYEQKSRLKQYGLNRLSIKQHIIVTICRDIPIYFILKDFVVILSQWYRLIKNPYSGVTTVRATEFFLASLWCLVSGLLSYTVLDGFMVRWMVIYEIQAAMVRILSMSLIIVMIFETVNYTFNNVDNEFCLAVWILSSCILTGIFIVQCFASNKLIIEKREITSIELLRARSGTNSSSELPDAEGGRDAPDPAASGTGVGNSGITGFKKKYTRKVDFYNLIVFAVVPIGVASFISTVGLVRLLLILRLDVGMEISRIQQHVLHA